jgi:methylmalonyl-CoA mutase N-terminal domain/subunit
MDDQASTSSTSGESPTDDARSRWQARYEQSRVRDADFTTLSGAEVEPAYGTETSEWLGEFPYRCWIYRTC